MVIPGHVVRRDGPLFMKKQEEPIERTEELFRICKWRHLVERKGANA